MWAERPWTGIGLDNFRLTYGPPLGLQGWDDTVHTNNWYLETLVSVGLLGAIPFFTWLGLLLGDVGIACTRPGAPLWRVSVGCGLMAFGVHGLVDYFLLFHATGLLFWILVGLWFGADEPERACP
jgi:O-antigen ligase